MLEDERLKEKDKKKRERRKKELEQRQLVLGTNLQADAVGGQCLLQAAPPSVDPPQDCSHPISVEFREENIQEILGNILEKARMRRLIEDVVGEKVVAKFEPLHQAIVRQQKTIDDQKEVIEKLENLEVLSLDHNSNVDPQSTVSLQNGGSQGTFDPNFGGRYDPVTGTFLDENQ